MKTLEIILPIAGWLLLAWLQYRIHVNTLKNWYNHNITGLKWSDSACYNSLVFFKFAALIPFVLIIVQLAVNIEYFTIKTVKLKEHLI